MFSNDLSNEPYAEQMTEFLETQHNVDIIPPVMLWFAFPLFLAIGLLCLIYPKGVWEITHIHCTWGGEPTKYYLVTTRIWGGILLAVGIACLVLLILQ